MLGGVLPARLLLSDPPPCSLSASAARVGVLFTASRILNGGDPMDPHFRVQTKYDLPRLKLLPQQEQPAYRLAANPSSCNRMIDISEIYHGSLNSSQVRMTELFKPFSHCAGRCGP